MSETLASIRQCLNHKAFIVMAVIELTTAVDRAKDDILTSTGLKWLRNANREIMNPMNGWKSKDQLTLLECHEFRFTRMADRSKSEGNQWMEDSHSEKISEISQNIVHLQRLADED